MSLKGTQNNLERKFDTGMGFSTKSKQQDNSQHGWVYIYIYMMKIMQQDFFQGKVHTTKLEVNLCHLDEARDREEGFEKYSWITKEQCLFPQPRVTEIENQRTNKDKLTHPRLIEFPIVNHISLCTCLKTAWAIKNVQWKWLHHRTEADPPCY